MADNDSLPNKFTPNFSLIDRKENLDKAKNIQEEIFQQKEIKTLANKTNSFKEDTYAYDTRTRIKRKIIKERGANYLIDHFHNSISRKTNKVKQKKRKDSKNQESTNGLIFEKTKSTTILAKPKKMYNITQTKFMELEEAKRHLNLEFGFNGARTGKGLQRNLYREKGINVGFAHKKIYIKTGYEKINTDVHLNRISGRRFYHDTKNVIKGSGKFAITGAAKTSVKLASEMKNQYIGTLRKEGGFSGESIAQTYDALKNVDSVRQLTLEGTRATKGLVQGAGKGINLAYKSTAKIGNIVSEKAKAGTNYYKKNKGNLKGAIKKDVQKRARQLRQQFTKKEIVKQIQNTIRKIKKKAIEAVKKVGRWLLGLIFTFALPLIIGILIIVIILIIIISLFGMYSSIYLPLEDYNSYKTVVNICEEYAEEWNYFIHDELPDEFTQPQVNCKYGNSNILEIEFIVDEGQEDEQEVHFILDPAQIYCLCIAKFEGEIGNLGVENGNKKDDEMVAADEIKEFIATVLEYYYPMNYMESERYIINQNLYICDEIFMDLQYDASGEKISDVSNEDIRKFQSIFEKPNLYLPKEHSEKQSEKNHEFIETFIEIKFINFTEVLNYLDLGQDILSNYEYYINAFVPHAKDIRDNKEKNIVPDWFWDTLIDFTVNDKLSTEKLSEMFEGLESKDITRKQFTDLIYSYCNPKGQIPYVWGGSSFSGSDCSGFISLMLRQINADISGWSGYLWEQSVSIDAAEAKPGDLVFKQSPSSNGINHIGFYVGSGYDGGIFCHCASGSGTICNNYRGFIYYRRLLIKFKDD